MLATAGRDGHVKTWDEKGKSIANLRPAIDAVMKVAFTPDAKTVVTGD